MLFRAMHALAEVYERERVNIDQELKESTPFTAWMRFEDPSWILSVERWLRHARWLSSEQFDAMKPALAKMYLDAFWWWDDYLRSPATLRLGVALERIAIQQQDTPWMKALQTFSEHWVSTWDEAQLRSQPATWHRVMDAITRLLSMFGLERAIIPQPLVLRRIHLLLCSFYAKALWYSGPVEISHARDVDEWLEAAAEACRTQPGDNITDNPNEWIRSWILLRRAEIWCQLDPGCSRKYLDGLDRKAIRVGDHDLRVGIALLIAELHWDRGHVEIALEVYSRAILISYAYNVKQEWRRRAPNIYTRSLYEHVLRRVERRFGELRQSGEMQMHDRPWRACERFSNRTGSVSVERRTSRRDLTGPCFRCRRRTTIRTGTTRWRATTSKTLSIWR